MKERGKKWIVMPGLQSAGAGAGLDRCCWRGKKNTICKKQGTVMYKNVLLRVIETPLGKKTLDFINVIWCLIRMLKLSQFCSMFRWISHRDGKYHGNVTEKMSWHIPAPLFFCDFSSVKLWETKDVVNKKQSYCGQQNCQKTKLHTHDIFNLCWLI